MDNINFIVAELIKEYCTDDPFEIANELGIGTIISPLGKIIGNYTVINDSKVFFINSNLSEVNKNIVCSALLGNVIIYSNLFAIFFDFNFDEPIEKFIKELLK